MTEEFKKARDEWLSDIAFDHPETILGKEDVLIAMDWAHEWCLGECLKHHPGNLKGYVKDQKKIAQLTKDLEIAVEALEMYQNIEGQKHVATNYGQDTRATFGYFAKGALTKIKGTD